MPEHDVLLDFDRLNRCGVDEAIFCASKTIDQIQRILTIAQTAQKRLLLTKLSYDKFRALQDNWQQKLQYNDMAQCAIYGKTILNETCPPIIAIVSAGTSDAFVCAEAATTLNYHGIPCDVFQDIGIAGLWRLQQHIDQLRTYDLIIAIAGMEAALPTVLAGLIDAPIIAVPTSIGYGVCSGGFTALNSCLASCAGGVMTMNIDNGYGAAIAAIKFYKRLSKYISPQHK